MNYDQSTIKPKAGKPLPEIVAYLLNSLYQNGFYMNPEQAHRIHLANTAND
jgi:hypothetical protein